MKERQPFSWQRSTDDDYSAETQDHYSLWDCEGSAAMGVASNKKRQKQVASLACWSLRPDTGTSFHCLAILHHKGTCDGDKIRIMT